MNNTGIDEKRLTLTVCGKNGAIGVRKNTYRKLGCPNYVSLRISYKKNSLMLCSCEAKDVMSYEAPSDFLDKKNRHFRIHSIGFVRNVLLKNQLNQEDTYEFEGHYAKNCNAVVFPLNKATIINEDIDVEQ